MPANVTGQITYLVRDLEFGKPSAKYAEANPGNDTIMRGSQIVSNGETLKSRNVGLSWADVLSVSFDTGTVIVKSGRGRPRGDTFTRDELAAMLGERIVAAEAAPEAEGSPETADTAEGDTDATAEATEDATPTAPAEHGKAHR